MLAVKLNIHQFEYDIHSLVKAFYPETDVKVFVEGEKDLVSEGDYPNLTVELYENRIGLQATFPEGESLVMEVPTETCINFETGVGRTDYKNELKQILYKGLSKVTGKELPWGTLTGIRPTKIPMTLLEEGKAEEEILKYMQDVYYVSDEKGKLAIDIAKREKELLSTIHYKDGYSLYIGIPFCPTTCLYCSFTSYPICVWKNREINLI